MCTPSSIATTPAATGPGKLDTDRRDYYMAFVEFDDQGWFADRRQMESLLTLLERLRQQKREVLIHVYAHGWKHNASACDTNASGLLVLWEPDIRAAPDR